MTLPDRKYLFLIAGLLLGFAAGFVTARETGGEASASASASTSSSGRPTLAADDRPSRGPSDAPVTIVEFTDYECPYCRRYYRQTYHQLLQEYEGEVHYVVRNYPLSIHPNARKAAEAAECAHNQDRFWDYHDHLFENADALEPSDLKSYARELGLDGGQFDECLESGAESQTVEQDMSTGRRLGIRGTPTFFVNGSPLVGAQPLSAFRSAIQRARGN
ncbi:MAG: thioredoxin domain-containing protein [Candidatus Palauibacterales bacterium]|nr:thioredoxin domain-containing protein [Candidatus Palauibacterales bacterium]